MKKKIVFIVNNSFFFVSHRLAIAEAALKKNYDVIVFSGINHNSDLEKKAINKIKSLKINHKILSFSSIRKNPFFDIIGFIQLFFSLLFIKPNIVHCISPKPNLYGSLISRFLGLKCVLAISGMGYLHTNVNLGKKILQFFYEYILNFGLKNKKIRLIVQNQDDKKYFLCKKFLKEENIKLIKGSGVCLNIYKKIQLKDKKKIVLFPARLLISKGILEFISMAEILKVKYPTWKFIIVGLADFKHPDSVNKDIFKKFEQNNSIIYKGYVEDIVSQLSETSIVCLPSHREGMPKVLLEAAAAKCSIVTTNTIGCREAIIHDKTGILVKLKNVKSLTAAVETLILNKKLRGEYSLNGEALAIKNYSIENVLQETFKVYDQLLFDKT